MSELFYTRLLYTINSELSIKKLDEWIAGEKFTYISFKKREN